VSRHLLVLLAALPLVACGEKDPDAQTDPDPETGDDTGVGEEEQEEVTDVCGQLGLEAAAFDPTAPTALQRHQPSGDFSVPLRDGTTWTLSEQWTGCETYVFLPHWFAISSANNQTYWSTGVDALIERSPPNVHYFFVVGGGTDDGFGEQMDGWIGEALASLSEEDAAWWEARLHVVDGPSGDLDGLVGDFFAADIGQFGFGIDRQQTLRTLGYFPHVEGYNSSLSDWPFEMRLFSAAYEPEYYNFEAEREARMAAVDADVIEVFGGEIYQEFEDGTLSLPDAATMAGYDTLELDITIECPDKDSYEPNNCGAWDYLAYAWLYDEATETWLEMARFITTYHRESRWVVDASHALAWLQDGGDRTVRFEWAPSWNTQPSGITFRARLSNQGKGVAPREAIPLFTGGSFTDGYNDRDGVEATIPSDAQKVELVAITTGHGMDDGNCAEFCDTEHHFRIGDVSWTQEFTDPGIDDGCAQKVGDGVVPNQAGTWWFGRNGWCPGQRVDPFTADVTAEAAPGSTVTVSYEATQGGDQPTGNRGNIRHNSWLIIHK
jgi:hypothetical protein